MATARILLLILVLSAGALLLDLSLPLGFAGGIPYAFILGVAWSSRSSELVIGTAVGSTFLTLVGYGLSPAAVSPDWIVFLNRFFALAVIWLLTGIFLRSVKIQLDRDDALGQREKALDQLRVLSGLIPICASCKKVRSSDGCWEGLESYIAHRSEAEFSHGICDTCKVVLYPEYTD